MDNLSPRQIKAAILIAHGQAKKTAGEKVGVSPQTISEWMRYPEFVALINQTKKSIMEDTRDMLRGNLTVAVESLNDLLKNGKNEKVKLETAKFIIEKSCVVLADIGLWDIGPQTPDEVETDMIGDYDIDSVLEEIYGANRPK